MYPITQLGMTHNGKVMTYATYSDEHSHIYCVNRPSDNHMHHTCTSIQNDQQFEMDTQNCTKIVNKTHGSFGETKSEITQYREIVVYLSLSTSVYARDGRNLRASASCCTYSPTRTRRSLAVWLPSSTMFHHHKIHPAILPEIERQRDQTGAVKPSISRYGNPLAKMMFESLQICLCLFIIFISCFIIFYN